VVNAGPAKEGKLGIRELAGERTQRVRESKRRRGAEFVMLR
jgi:hypothetical protein